MKERISVVRKKPGEQAELVEIDNTLKALQKEVGGYIETVTLATDAVIICNEEGRLLNLKPNIDWMGVGWFGTILVVGVDGEEFTDLPYPEFILYSINGGMNL